MFDRRTHIFLLLVIVGLMASLTLGCQNQAQEPDQDCPEGQDLAYNYYMDTIMTEWASSPHNNNLAAPSGRDQCILCHDGQGFAQEISVGEELGGVETPLNCTVCHGDRGSTIKQTHAISIPTKDTVLGGQGNLCMTCHNGRDEADITNPRMPYPHYGPQADVLTGSGGLRLESWGNLNNTYGHLNLPNSCVDCHLLEIRDHKNHEFKLQESDAQLICGRCHDSATSFDVQAKGDYDGNGKVEGIQTEVQGLLAHLERAISKQLAGGSYEGVHGALVFSDADGEAIDNVSQQLYLAAYNYELITADSSYGIHNPQFVVHLLQESYRALTGSDLPNAQMIKGEL